MAYITFTDATGAATLRNAFPAPGDRFANWTPMTRPYGDGVNRQSDGALVFFRERTDYGASFDLSGIPAVASDSSDMVAIADRLIAWLMQGGTCTVGCENPFVNVYTCGLWPGSTPSLRLTNPRTFEYTLSVQLLNLAASPAQMVCRYAFLPLPTGAIGLWYADQYVASPRSGIPNAIGGGALSRNLLTAPKRLFGGSPPYWVGNLVTVTDAEISQVVGATGDWYETQNITLPAGTYTYSIDAQWVSGATDVRIGSNAALSTKTLTASLATYSSTFTTAGGVINLFAIRNGSGAASTVNITNARLHPGSVDLGVDLLAGHVYFGFGNYDTQPTVVGNAVTVAGNISQRGLVQFPTAHSLTAFTVIAVGRRIAPPTGGQFQSILEKVLPAADFVTSFSGPSSEPLFKYNSQLSFSGTEVPSAGGDLWQYRNGDYHVITNRYATPNADMFMDGALGVRSAAQANLAATIQDLYFAKPEYNVHAVALWERALTDAEVIQATQFLIARAATKAVAVAANRLLIPEGDSITFGQSATNGSYAALFAPNSLPVVNGPIFARASATLLGNAGNSLDGRKALVDLALAGKGTRQAVLTILIGRNDLLGYGGGAAQYAADLATYIAARRAAGANKVVLCTVLPSTLTSFNAARNAFNAIITAGGWAAAHGVDAICDFAANATMGPDAAASDVTLYGDGTHPTNLGQATLEPIYRAVVNAL